MKLFRNHVYWKPVVLGALLAILMTSGAQALAEDLFVDSEQALGNGYSYDVALHDLNGDGHLDAFVANNGANKVWLNLGDGTFKDSTRVFGNSNSRAVALGDLDGDGSLDAFIANSGANKVWMNNGRGLLMTACKPSAVSTALMSHWAIWMATATWMPLSQMPTRETRYG